MTSSGVEVPCEHRSESWLACFRHHGRGMGRSVLSKLNFEMACHQQKKQSDGYMQVWQLQESALADPRRVKEGYACPTGARERIGLFRGKYNHAGILPCRRSVSDAARHPAGCSLNIVRLHWYLQALNMLNHGVVTRIDRASVHGILLVFVCACVCCACTCARLCCVVCPEVPWSMAYSQFG